MVLQAYAYSMMLPCRVRVDVGGKDILDRFWQFIPVVL
jgi:hypothetical protein